MTALDEYQRLEATGLWRENKEAQRVEVIVSFGDATVVLSDIAGRPLAHWSLPAIVRVQQHGNVLTYSPDNESSETLEVSDQDMVRALEKVQSAIAKRAPKPGRLRLILYTGLAVVFILTCLFWLPNALFSYASKILPEIKQSEFGEKIALQLGKTYGGFCGQPEGQAAATQLARLVSGDNTARGLVVPKALEQPALLPGSIIVIGENTLARSGSADALAGVLLVAHVANLRDDPLEESLRAAGLWPTLQFLARNQISDLAIQRVASAKIRGPAKKISTQSLITAFEAHEISTTPYALTLPNSEFKTWLLANDPYPAGSPEPIIPDGAWLGLKSICSAN